MKSKPRFGIRANIILLILALIFLISGCTGGGIDNSSLNTKYYQGYDSLEMTFLTDSPPSLFTYDQQGNNEMPITVQIKNKGASDSYGALYVHGYDPSIIDLPRTPTNNNVNYLTNPNGAVGLVGQGTYFGISANQGVNGNTNVGATVGFKSQTGQNYGASVFTVNGQLLGLNIWISPDRVGYGLAKYAFNTFANSFGWRAIIALEGDTPTTPGGGVEVYEFPAYIYAGAIPESLEQFNQPIWVTACFDYSTRATAMMCIDPHPTSNTEKACFARSVSLSGGQGAPVSVTRVDQQSSSTKVVFTIYIHHTKQSTYDDVYDYFSLYKCNPESGAVVKPTDKNVVYVADDYPRLSKQVLSCIPSDKRIRLDEGGNGQITCTADLTIQGTSQSAYEAPLQIELWYSYSKSIYRNVIIKKTSGI